MATTNPAAATNSTRKTTPVATPRRQPLRARLFTAGSMAMARNSDTTKRMSSVRSRCSSHQTTNSPATPSRHRPIARGSQGGIALGSGACDAPAGDVGLPSEGSPRLVMAGRLRRLGLPRHSPVGNRSPAVSARPRRQPCPPAGSGCYRAQEPAANPWLPQAWSQPARRFASNSTQLRTARCCRTNGRLRTGHGHRHKEVRVDLILKRESPGVRRRGVRGRRGSRGPEAGRQPVAAGDRCRAGRSSRHPGPGSHSCR
jgi:hypothetical protein